MSEQLLSTMQPLLDLPGVKEVLILLASIIVAVVARLGLTRVILRFARKTQTEVDDKLVEACRGPLVYVVLITGMALVVAGLEIPERLSYFLLGVLKTVAVIYIGVALNRIGVVVLEALSRQIDRFSFVQPKTLPLLDMVVQVLVFGGTVYFIFVAWHIDVTTWLASAGIIGIAVGFAAKDTLANLFSGIFILADAPYKIGDFVNLDNGLRGAVVDIGIRSTRILTRDDIEVTVPNSVIASSQIVNETSGRHEKMRVRVAVAVAYGSDIDKVREVMVRCAEGVAHVVSDPPPRARFRSFGDSGLDFQLQVWVEQPVFRGRVLDALNSNVYKAFAKEAIEIPFNRLDVSLLERHEDT